MSILEKLKKSVPPSVPVATGSNPVMSQTAWAGATTAANSKKQKKTMTGTTSPQKPKSGMTSTVTANPGDYVVKPRPNDGKRIKVGAEYGTIINDMASQYYIRFDAGDSGYIMKSDKHEVL